MGPFEFDKEASEDVPEGWGLFKATSGEVEYWAAGRLSEPSLGTTPRRSKEAAIQDAILEASEEERVLLDWKKADHPEHLYLFAHREMVTMTYALNEEDASNGLEAHHANITKELDAVCRLERSLMNALSLLDKRKQEIRDYLKWEESAKPTLVPFDLVSGQLDLEEKERCLHDYPYEIFYSVDNFRSTWEFRDHFGGRVSEIIDQFAAEAAQPLTINRPSWKPLRDMLYDYGRGGRDDLAVLETPPDEDEEPEDSW
jgi:hypothetical protein